MAFIDQDLIAHLGVAKLNQKWESAYAKQHKSTKNNMNKG